MKKILLLALATLTLAGCQDKEQYELAIIEQLEQDQDLKDYNIAPQDMSSCVVEFTSKKMPGIFAYDPKRLETYRSYTKMLSLSKSEHPEQVLAELRTEFGSPKGLADAHANYAESVVGCLAAIISNSEEDSTDKKVEKPVALK